MLHRVAIAHVAIATAAGAKRPRHVLAPRQRLWPMRLGTFSIIALVLIGIVAAGAVFLLVWEPQAPTKRIERTIPDDKLPR